jgi:small-conductance mechanosensitive channel
MSELLKFMDFKLITLRGHEITLGHILWVILIIIISKLILWSLKKLLTRNVDDPTELGRRLSAYALGQYIVWIIAVILSLEALEFDITILLAGSAAFLVGIGLGLQDLFRDFISGIVMLFDGTIRVGDVLEVDGIVGEVKEMRLRTSILVDLDGIVLIIPNSKFVTQKVVNWTHNQRRTRFDVTVGVAYGSDVNKVKEVLIECAKGHNQVGKSPEPIVQFMDFADSQLTFRLLFFSTSVFAIQNVKSDLRFSIIAAFKEHGISIPFPQRDLHIKHQSTIDRVDLGNDPKD